MWGRMDPGRGHGPILNGCCYLSRAFAFQGFLGGLSSPRPDSLGSPGQNATRKRSREQWYRCLFVPPGAAPGCDGGPPFVGDGVEALCAGRFPARDAPEYSRWVVHFYGRGCRRCRAAAEALAGAARLAVSAPSGRAAPLLGAVDCQGSANEALCQEHGAWKLPVVKALGSGARYAGSFEEEELHRWAAEAAGTPVRSASAVPAPLCPAHELYDEPSFAKQFLLAHNVYRCMAGVPLLVWDSRAFATAKRWAEKAPVNRLQHSPEARGMGRLGNRTGRTWPTESGSSPARSWPGGTARSAACAADSAARRGQTRWAWATTRR
ncbi:unnamed protein product [Prorocentrum cordatum]|uniref:SCP domain-containing protein n=1 Tax=Prorocentrum cordatum TaxID=2364126 RepID=A0ABN9XVS3_9DINO|nr:unnamed protein product [Polarella glacialis]